MTPPYYRLIKTYKKRPHPNALLIQQVHKFIAAGMTTIGGADHFAIAGYDAKGIPDPNFGDQGKVNTVIGNFRINRWLIT